MFMAELHETDKKVILRTYNNTIKVMGTSKVPHLTTTTGDMRNWKALTWLEAFANQVGRASDHKSLEVFPAVLPASWKHLGLPKMGLTAYQVTYFGSLGHSILEISR